MRKVKYSPQAAEFLESEGYRYRAYSRSEYLKLMRRVKEMEANLLAFGQIGYEIVSTLKTRRYGFKPFLVDYVQDESGNIEIMRLAHHRQKRPEDTTNYDEAYDTDDEYDPKGYGH